MSELSIAKSLNKAYRQVPVDRPVFDGFKAQLRNYYEQISVINTEEKLKGDLMDFLKFTFYGQNYKVSPNGDIDCAIHLNHKFDTVIGAFGLKKGDYEKNTLYVLRRRGHVVTLESELAPNGVKTPDGLIDGMVMDIKATEKDGKWSVKKKIHSAAKQGAECIILYFHEKRLFSLERINDGWKKFLVDKDSQPYVAIIKRVICVVEDKAFDWHPSQ